MKNKYLFVFIPTLTLLIGILVYLKTENIQQTETKVKVFEEVSNDSPDVKINNDYPFFNSAPDIDSYYTQVLGFLPNEDNLESIKVKDVSYPYIKLNKNQRHILGTIVFENKTKENMNVQSFFMQGNKVAKVKMNNSNEWAYSILYDVQPESSVEININIEWDKDGMNELIFFPLEHSGIEGLYSGQASSIQRYFVTENDTIVNNDTYNQAFDLDLKNTENINVSPIPKWIGKNKQELKYLIDDGTLVTKAPIEGMKLEPIPYNTYVDIVKIDEKGKSSILIEQVNVKKNKPTYIYFDAQQLKELRTSKVKNYLLILNNREKELLSDAKAVDLGLKPFPTSFQAVIEFYKESN
ncbi:hypothetical protein ACQKMV_07605 [Lysinibacillus sp. NPDC094403]|uniref:hypothetical protein n=1 Tax=Lysinibacillus sp. NPDC094403 TaxID=3390581 RepID=UPI003D046E15